MSKGISLTDKQKLFADEYLIDLNATAAYKRAGYTASDQDALKRHLAKIECNLAEMPIEVLQEAKRRQEIDKHNAMIDQLKREKKASRTHG